MPTSTLSTEPLVKKIDRTRVPAHVAIIMDGNGRWAKQQGLARLFGHREGTRSVKEIVEAASLLGVRVLTLYSFSTENWARPRLEIQGLMALLKNTLRKEEPHLKTNNVRLDTIGDLSRLPPDVQDQVAKSMQDLSKNTGLTLVLALNYGGRQDILQAVNRLVALGCKDVTDELLTSHLYTAKYPEPDLVIRTSGEFRVSNFLLWQIAYSEIYVTPVLWPDFRKPEFYQAILDFQSRGRRYGGIG